LHYITLLAAGFALGAANIIPGVSGATLAVIMRLYDRLIDSINGLIKEPRKSLLFLLPVGFGMVIGIITVGSLIDGLFVRFSFQTIAFITGLMAGSIPFIYEQATSKDGKKPVFYTATVLAAALIIALALTTPAADVSAASDFDVGQAVLLFVGGVLAAAAMVIPGASGTMVLLLMGLYPTTMRTLSQVRMYIASPFDFGQLPPIIVVAAPLGLGMAFGVLLASKLIAVLLKKHFCLTYSIIIGLMLGTIFTVFKSPQTYQSVQNGMTATLFLFGAAAFMAGTAMSLLFGKRPAKNHDE